MERGLAIGSCNWKMMQLFGIQSLDLRNSWTFACTKVGTSKYSHPRSDQLTGPDGPQSGTQPCVTHLGMTTRAASSRNSPTRNPMSSRPSAESRATLAWHRTCLRWRCHGCPKQMPAPLQIDGWKNYFCCTISSNDLSFSWVTAVVLIHGSDPVRPASRNGYPFVLLGWRDGCGSKPSQRPQSFHLLPASAEVWLHSADQLQWGREGWEDGDASA